MKKTPLFRAKTKAHKRWITDQCNIHYTHNGEVELGDDKAHFWSKWWAVDDTTLGRSLGLVDSNGTAIYEGDIVEVNVKLDKNGVAIKEIGVVTWQRGAMVYAVHDPSGKMKREHLTPLAMNFLGPREKYVRGNIWDNPDLLNQKL